MSWHSSRVTEPQAEQLAQDCYSYCDSVKLTMFGHPFPGELLTRLHQHCEKLIHHPSNSFDIVVFTLWLHQPRKRAIEILDERKLKFTEVHIAHDIITESAKDADLLAGYIRRHHLSSWRPREKLTAIRSTSYTDFHRPRVAGKKTVLYSSKPSKPTGELFCCHFELRIAGRDALLLARVRTPRQLLELDHTQFWERRLLMLEIPDAEILGMNWLRAFFKGDARRRSRFPNATRLDQAKWAGSLILRCGQSEPDGDISVNDLVLWLRQRRPFGKRSLGAVFPKLPIDWMLPPPENALWAYGE